MCSSNDTSSRRMNFMKFLSAIFNSAKPSQDKIQLEVEHLEQRMMLSTVQIFAAGTQGGEQLQLQINGNVAETFEIAAGTSILNDQVFTFENG